MTDHLQIVDDAARRMTLATWSSAAPAWAAHADDIDARESAVTHAMLQAADISQAEQVLELGCGPGGVGIAAAEIIGCDGVVVMSDIVREMTQLAERRANRRGLDNVMTSQIDLERIDYPDRSFDVVLCREALMLAADPLRALRESHRVLRPGGRAAFAVWGPREGNPWLGVLLNAVQTQLGVAIPPPGGPGPFALSDDGLLERLLTTAGFGDVAVSEVLTPMRVSSFEMWWAMVPSLAGPLAQLLTSLPAEVNAAVRDAAADATAAFACGEGYELPGLSLVGSARCTSAPS